MIYSCRVIKGAGRGKVLGFPTLNLDIPSDFNYQPGVYATLVYVGQKKYLGALHFGPVPVFNQTKQSLEIHLINYMSYSRPHTLSFKIIKFIRPVKDFPNPDALATQIALDIEAVKQISL